MVQRKRRKKLSVSLCASFLTDSSELCHRSNNMSIVKIHAREIFDSRGNPTVEVDLYTGKGLFRAAVPAVHLLESTKPWSSGDNDKSRYLGKVCAITAIVFPF
ncbi:alpha-enolase-like [Larimichthys crocea]|uniref:alpha-enolase-like n=1 Tax=Larimichthys crocea TaxID=215358 RepID=UPI000F5E04EF|nr:alpha-enolase-like [Larimichthys crocea]